MVEQHAAQTFLLPDLGEGLTEAVIVRWLVAVGDEIAIDQAVAEVETAKSVVELPSPFAGRVLALHGEEGETVLTGAPVLDVGSEGASGNVLIGYGTGALAATGRRRRRAHAPAQSGVAPPTAGQSAASREAFLPPGTTPVAVRSPIVRRLARELGVDPRSLRATGSDGAVTRADVLAAADRGRVGAADRGRNGAADRLTPLEPTDTPVARRGSTASMPPPVGEVVPGLHGLHLATAERLSPLRKAVSAKMSRSRAEIPEATVWVDVDFTELWKLRPLMAGEGERPPTLTALIARFVLLALAEYPLLASRLSDDGSELLCFDGINLGIAVDARRGLSVPVLPRAHELSLAELDAALRELSAAARTGRLDPTRFSGSTFTCNNYGGLGVDGSAAIINHPEVAILGIGRIIERPWVRDGEIVARRIAQLSLVFDHRVCDGGYAAGFIRSLVARIEQPLRVYPRL